MLIKLTDSPDPYHRAKSDMKYVYNMINLVNPNAPHRDLGWKYFRILVDPTRQEILMVKNYKMKKIHFYSAELDNSTFQN